MITIDLDVNGRKRTGTVAPRTHLADFLREELNLTGTHLGCEHGVCGACTLMVDGRPVRSCLMLAAACHGATVRTIEGLDDDPLMVCLRQAFSKHHGLQCGYCTPGMLMTAYDIVRRLPGADAPRIREELSGNLCRCTGYMGIVAAIIDVLAHDPPAAAIQPMRPASAKTLPVSAAKVLSGPSETNAGALAPVSVSGVEIAGGTRLERDMRLSAPGEAVWRVLQDVTQVAACLPGARIDDRDGDIVNGSFAVAIGPMKARFAGRAVVAYAREDRAGTVTGSGNDPTSRSAAEGALRFAVAEDSASTSVVTVALTYRLKGPLAQFGRPALVATVVDQMLAVFTRNLAATALGGAPAETSPLDGVGILRHGLVAWLKRLTRRS